MDLSFLAFLASLRDSFSSFRGVSQRRKERKGYNGEARNRRSVTAALSGSQNPALPGDTYLADSSFARALSILAVAPQM